MQTFKLHYQSYSIEQLPKELYNLVVVANEAATHAYAPYSNFNVGVAALLSDGTILKSSNQESVSFPAGLCAERVMLFSFFNNEHRSDQKIEVMVVAARKNGSSVSVSPCGICRQSMVEAEQRQGQNISVIFLNGERYIVLPSAKMLLPFSFQNF